jgi:hypothetical protein
MYPAVFTSGTGGTAAKALAEITATIAKDKIHFASFNMIVSPF